ncbi:hypothetical protein B0H15DRAFT_898835 [Mycena belliarum]|uniref:Uncharacterized protein n=1 Tax=Mycena belliarum TaxID=1033014 RepID=A0AAD6UL50_9AGAR|nr:hypothetical protein B0H15DRAFT_898835 [Mycena belliae]
MSAAQVSATGSRSRPQARKKANDDAAYFGPPSSAAGAKRHAAEKADGEPRTKRKRVDAVLAPAHRRDDADARVSLVEFIKMPTPVLYRYLTQFDLVPAVYPSPLLASDPPAPLALESSAARQASRAPSPPAATPANRPRRESKEQTTRRRSSRLVEEEAGTRPPILADMDELHGVLAGMAERHFRDLASISGRDEVDTLATFMCCVEKRKGKL